MTDRLKIVEVEWVDSAFIHLGWASREDYLEENYVRPIRTVGFLLSEDDDTIFLAASSHAGEKKDIGECFVIPRGAVKAVHELRRR